MIFDLAEFWDGLGVTSAMFSLPDLRSMDADGSGSITPTQIGQRTWGGEVSIRVYEHAEARAISARIEAMKEPDALFWLSPSHRQVTGATGTLAGVATDRRRVTFTGLDPVAGDYVGINNGSTYGLHQVVRQRTDDAGGAVAYHTVIPPLPFALAAGDAATTSAPVIKARIGKGTTGPSYVPVLSGEFSFEFYQVLT